MKIRNTAIASFLLLLSTFVSGQTSKIPYKIENIRAYLFYNQNDEDGDEKVAGTFSENIIDNDNFELWNTIIGEGDAKGPSDQTLVIVKVSGNPDDYVRRKLTLTAIVDEKVILKKTNEFAILNGVAEYYAAFMLYDTGCDIIKLKAEILNNQTVESSMKKEIVFQCSGD